MIYGKKKFDIFESKCSLELVIDESFDAFKK
jgi:hypothetical protein